MVLGPVGGACGLEASDLLTCTWPSGGVPPAGWFVLSFPLLPPFPSSHSLLCLFDQWFHCFNESLIHVLAHWLICSLTGSHKNASSHFFTDLSTLLLEIQGSKNPNMDMLQKWRLFYQERVWKNVRVWLLSFRLCQVDMAPGPITSWQIDGETVADFIFWAPKSLQMMTAAMKLKDTCFLEGKLWPT